MIKSAFKFLVVVIIILACSPCRQVNVTPPKETKETKKPRVNLYGLNEDSLIKIDGVIKRGESLSEILNKHKISPIEIDKLSTGFDSIFNPKRIRPGKKYILFLAPKTKKARYFLYERDDINYSLISFGDSISARKGKKPTTRKLKQVGGEIRTSLWNAMHDIEVPFKLALKLADIFAWTVDFFAIQEGDQFKAYYEEIYVGGERAGIGKVLGAWMKHFEKTQYAIYYNDGEIEGYYDEKGKNLKRKFLKSPIKFCRVTSGFSHSRMHPILHRRRPHYGVDLAAPIGTPVHSIGEGRVIFAAWSGGAGRMIKIKHPGSFVSKYLHLSGFAKGIRSGAMVEQGQTIGYVGSSGLSTGPHLDFRVYKAGRPINPLKVESDPLPPLDSAKFADFKDWKDSVVKILKKTKIRKAEEEAIPPLM